MKGVENMKKNNLFVSLGYIFVGTMFLLAALVTETKLEGIFSGLAGAGIGPGILMLYRYFYWKSPKRSQQYQELLETEQIERHDELKEKIRGFSARYTYALGIIITSFAMLIFTILGSLDIHIDYRAIVIYLGCYLAFQCIFSTVIFNKILRRYQE